MTEYCYVVVDFAQRRIDSIAPLCHAGTHLLHKREAEKNYLTWRNFIWFDLFGCVEGRASRSAVRHMKAKSGYKLPVFKSRLGLPVGRQRALSCAQKQYGSKWHERAQWIAREYASAGECGPDLQDGVQIQHSPSMPQYSPILKR